MNEIILVRHGETQFNREEMIRGAIDVPLNGHGLRQAKATAAALSSDRIAAVYASPLTRAMQTARAACDSYSLELRLHPGFADMHFGAWEGLTLEEVRARYPQSFKRWERTPHLVRPPGGETLGAVRRRAVGALKEIVASTPGTILVVSHRVVTKLLLLWALGLESARFWAVRQDTACINRFSLEGGRRILTLMNDTCHLAALEGQRKLRDF